MLQSGAPAGGYCASTCNRCPSGASPAPGVSPSPAVSAATPGSPALGTTSAPLLPGSSLPLTTSASPLPSATPGAGAAGGSTPPTGTSSPAGSSAASPLPQAAAASPAGCPDVLPPGPTYTCAQQVRHCPALCKYIAFLLKPWQLKIMLALYLISWRLQASFGQCGASFMFQSGAPAGGYCAATCNRCPSGATAAANTSPSPAVPAATVQPPAPGPTPKGAAGGASLFPGTGSPTGTSSPAGSPAGSPAPQSTTASPASCTDQPPPGSTYSCAQQVGGTQLRVWLLVPFATMLCSCWAALLANC